MIIQLKQSDLESYLLNSYFPNENAPISPSSILKSNSFWKQVRIFLKILYKIIDIHLKPVTFRYTCICITN